MTEIRSIHGVPANEFASRGLMFNGQSAYIPYLSMTQGEMRLALRAQQAKVYAAAFPENPEYSRAVTLISNALNSGVSRGVSFVGALGSPMLQQVAAEISRASRQQKPASSAGFYGRDSLADGIHIGAIIPVADRLAACMKAAQGNPQKTVKCFINAKIEEILNSGVEKSGHHMLYKNLKSSDSVPSTVGTKMVFQKSGVEGLANAGSLNASLMYDWVETAILQKNAAGNVGPAGSRETSFALGGKADPKIGLVLTTATIIAITGLITAALGGAAALLKALRSEKAYAMSEAKGFGTDAISANQDDWSGLGPSTGDNSNFLLIGGAAVAAYLLLDK